MSTPRVSIGSQIDSIRALEKAAFSSIKLRHSEVDHVQKCTQATIALLQWFEENQVYLRWCAEPRHRVELIEPLFRQVTHD